MKNGFTLIELLAVIVILTLLALIAVPSAMNISSSIKKNMYCEKVDILLTDAKRWGDEHLGELSTDCYIEKTVAFLVEQGITNKESDQPDNTETPYIINPYSGTGMDEDIIGIYKKNRRAYAFYVLKGTGLDSDVINVLNGACEEIPICGEGQDELEDNCVKRPTNKC